MLLTFYFTKTSMIDIFDLKYRFVPTQTQTTFCCSVTQSCLALSTPRTAACQASLSFTISWSFLKLMSIESSDAIKPSHPLLPPSPPAFNLSQHQGLFHYVGLHIRWPKYWSFSISSTNKYSGLISLRIDWFDLLAIQENLVSILQIHNLESLILQDLAFFMALLSHLSVHEYWKDNRFDNRFSYMDLFWQSNVSAFLTCYLGWLQLFFQDSRVI